MKDQISDAIDIADGVPRKDINRSLVGVNAFFNDPSFGTIPQQYAEILNTLHVRYVRILMAWNDAIQPTPGSSPNFSFYDSIVQSIPAGMDALVVVTGIPSWMNSPSNWVDGNPRRTFVERWVRWVARRYGGQGRVVGWEIWNEPNDPSRSDNATLGLTTSPENFVELVSLAYDVCKDVAPSKLVLNGATTAINQNFSETLDYNRSAREAGLFSVIDRFAIHYYGRQFENVVRSDGVADFLSSVPNGIWVTESGAQGVDEQLRYVEQVWPFLSDHIPRIERFYYYQMFERSAPDQTYGLRNSSADRSVSDLYVSLRDGS